jgi:hypothetical protein
LRAQTRYVWERVKVRGSRRSRNSLLPLNEDMLKYKQYAHIAVPMGARITVSTEKWVCTHMALLFLDRERRER